MRGSIECGRNKLQNRVPGGRRSKIVVFTWERDSKNRYQKQARGQYKQMKINSRIARTSKNYTTQKHSLWRSHVRSIPA